MQSGAVANALSGEATYKTVSYAITGDPETDLIAGLVAVVDSTDRPPSMTERVMRYLLQRYEAIAEEQRKAEDRVAEINKAPSHPPNWGGMASSGSSGIPDIGSMIRSADDGK